MLRTANRLDDFTDRSTRLFRPKPKSSALCSSQLQSPRTQLEAFPTEATWAFQAMSLIGCGRLSLCSRIGVSLLHAGSDSARANNANSRSRSRVELVFAEQKDRMGAIVEQRIRLTGIHDRMGNCNAKRRLCATLECPIKDTAAYC